MNLLRGRAVQLAVAAAIVTVCLGIGVWLGSEADTSEHTTVQEMFSNARPGAHSLEDPRAMLITEELRTLNEDIAQSLRFPSGQPHRPHRALQYYRMSPHCPATDRSIRLAFDHTGAFSQSTDADPVLKHVWDTFWVCSGTRDQAEVLPSMNRGQTINIFPDTVEVTTNKANLCQFQKSFWGNDEAVASHLLRCYNLPDDADAFTAYTQKHPSSVFVSKLNNACCGRGIQIVPQEEIQPHNKSQSGYFQLYEPQPDLVLGKKYDLRLFVLVTSVAPLRVFVSSVGFARVSVAEFVDPRLSSHEMFRHITNVHFQNKDSRYFTVTNSAHDMKASQVRQTKSSSGP